MVRRNLVVGGRLDENIHLLADANGQSRTLQRVDDLQHPGVNAFRAISGERLLWQNVQARTGPI